MKRVAAFGYGFLTLGAMMSTMALLDTLFDAFEGRLVALGAGLAMLCFFGLAFTWGPQARRAVQGEVA